MDGYRQCRRGRGVADVHVGRPVVAGAGGVSRSRRLPRWYHRVHSAALATLKEGMMETTVALFGITGRTGRAVLAAAMARGWSVRGLVRDGSAAPDAERLTVVRGSLDDRDAIGDTLAGADAAVIVFGPRSGRDTFCASATDAIVATMQASGCRRLVCQTGAMLGDSVGNRSLAMNTMARLYEWMQPSMARDRRDQEAAVMASGLDWTIVCIQRRRSDPGNV